MNRTRCQVPKQGLLLLTAALLSGCAGPSTRVLPQRQGGTMQEVPDEIPVVEEVNSFYCRNRWASFPLLRVRPEAGRRTVLPAISRSF